MYLIGVFLVGFGVVMSLLMGVAFFAINTLAELLAIIICAGVVAAPSLMLGVYLVRRAEDSGLLSTGTSTKRLLPESENGAEAQSPLTRLTGNFGSFDLNRLNVYGWMTLLAAFYVPLGLAAIAGMAIGAENLQDRRAIRVIGLAILPVAIGIFFATKAAFQGMGLSIYRDPGRIKSHA